jgi:hypothetical protein
LVLISLALIAFAATGYFARTGQVSQFFCMAIVIVLTAALWFTGKV